MIARVLESKRNASPVHPGGDHRIDLSALSTISIRWAIQRMTGTGIEFPIAP